MPNLNVTTKEAKQTWQSPDGQRVLFDLTLDYEGQPVSAKTFSRKIATVGWSGTVETYEKAGRNGIETFVKQPQQEGVSYPSGGGRHSQPKDEKAIQAMWAITKALEWAAIEKSVKLEDVEVLARDFNAMVDRVKEGEPVEPADEVHEVTDAPIDLGKIDEIFKK